jgi:hypothetical protein
MTQDGTLSQKAAIFNKFLDYRCKWQECMQRITGSKIKRNLKLLDTQKEMDYSRIIPVEWKSPLVPVPWICLLLLLLFLKPLKCKQILHKMEHLFLWMPTNFIICCSEYFE